MFKLFIEGGPLFMGILTIIFVFMLAVSIWSFVQIQSSSFSLEELRRKIKYIKSIGLFALVFGILGQLIGLFQAFTVIEQMESVSSAILAGGLKVSMITTLYGMIIYAISILIWMGLDWTLKKLHMNNSSS